MAIDVGPFQQIVAINMGGKLRLDVSPAWLVEQLPPTGFAQSAQWISAKIGGIDLTDPDIKAPTSANYPDALGGLATWRNIRQVFRDVSVPPPDDNGFYTFVVAFAHSEALESTSGARTLRAGVFVRSFTGGLGDPQPINERDSTVSDLKLVNTRTSPPTGEDLTFYTTFKFNPQSGEFLKEPGDTDITWGP